MFRVEGAGSEIEVQSSSERAGDMRFSLVLTASVTPAFGARVKRSDPGIRMRDYVLALKWWLAVPDRRLRHIVFLENSGADLSELRLLAETHNPFGKAVEFISIHPREIPQGKHYGWGELKMLSEGLRLADSFRETTHFIKATGRLTFPDIAELLNQLPPGLEIMLDSRVTTSTEHRLLQFLPPAGRRIVSLIPAILLRQNAYATTQLMIAAKSAFMRLIDASSTLMDQGECNMMENAVYTVVSESNLDGVFLRFPVNCEPRGVGAEAEDNYDSNSKRVTSQLRALSRKLGLWL